MTKVNWRARRCAGLAGALFAAAGLSACAAGGGDGPSFSLPEMPAVASITAPSDESPKGNATELYARVASGANTCWFGAAGPLKKVYIYHAEADAPSRGGKAEIVIHEREPSQPNPRGAKAYRITILPTGETSATVATENLKMSEAFAAAMADDVTRWSKGEHGCVGHSTAAGWVPAAPQAAVTAKPQAKPAKSAKSKSGPVPAKSPPKL